MVLINNDNNNNIKSQNQLSPFVYWAQTENQITLKVDLKDVKVNIYLYLYYIIKLINYK